MQILLTTLNSKYIHQNLAIRLLYALNSENKNLSWKEFTIKEEIAKVAEYCAKFDVVALSCYIWNITKTLELATAIKELNPNCKILLGGPEVSFDFETLITNNDIDYIIPHEGEIPFALFLKNFPNLNETKGVVWKNNDTIYYTPNDELYDVQLLQKINPYGYDLEEELRTKISYIEASRGCPYRCSYCLAGLDNKLRYLPLQAVKNNLLYVMQYAKTIKFLDRTFNAKPEFAIEILQFILDNHKGTTQYQFEIKADLPQESLISYINSSVPKGVFRFEIGIQTLNAQSNDSIQRKQDFENIRSFIRQVEKRVDIHLDLIVGLPHDRWENVKYSFEEVFRLFQPELQLGFLKFLKGTDIRENAAQHNYRFDPLPPYQIIESAYLNAQQLSDISLVEHALDIYWNKKRAVNAMRYVAEYFSIFDFLLKLGEYFEQQSGLHSFSINNVYDNLYRFAERDFAHDRILAQLIALDYYLHHKTKPALRYFAELEKEQKHVVIEQFGLHIHQYRYIIHEFDFDVQHWMEYNEIKLSKYYLVLQYDGVQKVQIVYKQSTFEEI